MIILPNNCRRGEFNVHPSNWKTSKAKITDNWYAECRFIDPRYLAKYPKGKIIRIRAGINRIKNISERRRVLQKLIDEMEGLFSDGYNPFTDVEVVAAPIPQSDVIPKKVLPSTLFIPALRFALSKSTSVRETILDAKSVIKSLEAAAMKLGFLTIPISEIQVMHLKLCLDECHKNNPRFSAKRFNKAKAYLSGLFKLLVELGASPGNMAKAVNPMKEEPSKPVFFTDEQIEIIKDHLWNYNRPFLKFVMMFYYSGSRLKEFCRLQGKDVDLVEQTYTTLIIKGNKPRWVSRTIRNVALPYWKEQMLNCKPDDYVFSKGLLPGPGCINSKQITRRWTTHIQKPLGISVTIYKLKHRNTDRTVKALSLKMAAGQNAHTTTRMAEDVYAYNYKKQVHESLKALDIEL